MISVLDRRGYLGVAGTALLAISSQFGFIAPVLAAEAPATLDAIIAYLPVVIFNGFAAVGFIVGYAMLGISIATSRVFHKWSGILIAVGAPVHLVGFGVAQLGSPALVRGRPRQLGPRLGACVVWLSDVYRTGDLTRLRSDPVTVVRDTLKPSPANTGSSSD